MRYYYQPHFTDKKAKDQKAEAPCPRPPSQEEMKLVFKPRQSGPRTHMLNPYFQ